MFWIFFKGLFDLVGIVWALYVLSRFVCFHRVGGVEYLVMFNRRIRICTALAKEVSVVPKVVDIGGVVSREGYLGRGFGGGL